MVRKPFAFACCVAVTLLGLAVPASPSAYESMLTRYSYSLAWTLSAASPSGAAVLALKAAT